nr:MAG TPA: hypothetical protein [Caudoviricetes sp.]
MTSTPSSSISLARVPLSALDKFSFNSSRSSLFMEFTSLFLR